MKKLAVMLAVVGLMTASASADLTPSTFNPTAKTLTHSSAHSVGVYGGPGVLYSNFKATYVTSDTFSLTFAFHWPYSGFVYGLQLQSSLVWDNSELEIVGVGPPLTGPFVDNGATGGTASPKNYNYPAGSTWWAGPSSGTLQVGDVLGTGVPLWINPAPPGVATISGSGIYPFMKVDFHVKGVIPDSFMDVYIASAALIFWDATAPGTWWTGGAIAAPTPYGAPTSFGMGVIPEPASMSLLALGLVSLGAGVWRRRR